MKKFIFAALLIAGFSFTQTATAQVRININIGNQPAWGPVGYDYARYYYLPEYNVYYDVAREQFIYPNRRSWVYGRSLPASYGRVNLYNTYKVVVNRNYEPYRDNSRDIQSYRRYSSSHNQAVIRDSREYKYYESKYHPKHKEWNNGRNNNNRDRDQDYAKRGRR